MPSYQIFKSERLRYHTLLQKDGEIEFLEYSGVIKPGETSAEFALILERMAYLGFIPKNNYSLIDRYDSIWIDDIKHIQGLHGQDVDGVIGKRHSRC